MKQFFSYSRFIFFLILLDIALPLAAQEKELKEKKNASIRNQKTEREREREREHRKGIKNNREEAFDEEDEENEKYDGPAEIAKYEFEITKDPAIGRVPIERLLTAITKTRQSKAHSIFVRGIYSARSSSTPLSWTERGPYSDGVASSNGNTRANTGKTSGRIRSVMVDSSDATKKTVWVGGVNGGLWKTTDITAATPTWTLVNDYFANMAVTDICQDPRPAYNNIIYFCTGEGYYNGDAAKGNGVFKSTDYGLNWTQLSSTSGYPYGIRILCDYQGNVYWGTRDYGLRRSLDGGSTWTVITPSSYSSVSDIKISSTSGPGRLHIVTGISGTSVYRYTDDPTNVSTSNWTSPVTGFPLYSSSRNELACNGTTLYALPTDASSQVNTIYKSTDGGANWAATSGQPSSGWASQSWYALAAGINQANSNEIIVGGLDSYKSTDGGATWTKISNWVGTSGQYVHADIHKILWYDGGNKLIYSCDGGIHFSADKGVTIRDRNVGLRLKQFYSCAIHPSASSNYFLAGAQDNGVHQLNGAGLTSSLEVTGGDGAFVSIDQNQPSYQYGSYVYNTYRRSTDGGTNWSSINFYSGSALNYSNFGSFINPNGYDDSANIFYAAADLGTYFRWTNPQTLSSGSYFTSSLPSGVSIVSGISAFNNGRVSAVKASPYIANRVYFGLNNGRVVKIDRADTVSTSVNNAAINLSSGTSMTGTVSSVNVGSSDQYLIASFSNYGVSNVWVSADSGKTWTAVDGNLPDMPVRWCMYYPGDNNKAIIATETGVWETTFLNGASTVWTADVTFPTVRTTMLKTRISDNTILASTHGRGLFTTSISCIVSPAAPSGLGASRCGQGSLTISASAGTGETIDWYDTSIGGTLLLSGNNSYTTGTINSTTTYYAQTRNITTGCVSDTRSAITATIITLPSAPAGTGTSRCGTGTLTISVTASTGKIISWYAASSGGSILSGGAAVNSFTIPSLLSTTTYYAQSLDTSTGCISATRTPVIATINSFPSAPSAIGGSGCEGGSALISASVNTGQTIDWYAANNGGSILVEGNGVTSFTTPAISNTTTYYAESRNISTGCTSLIRTPVTAIIILIPSAPTANDTSICSGTNTILTASGVATLSWYSDSLGGNYLGSGNHFATPALSIATTYYIQDSTCATSTSRTAVTVNINERETTLFSPIADVCAGGNIILPDASLNGFTGIWNPSINNSTTTDYTFTPDSGQCALNANLTITVIPRPTGAISLFSINADSTQLQIDLTGTGPWSGYLSNGTPFSSSVNQAIITITPNPIASSITYTISSLSDNYCSSLKSDLSGSVTIGNPTGIISGSTSLCNGDSAILSISLTGNGPWSGTLSDNTIFSGNENPVLINVYPSSSIIYTIASLTDAYKSASAEDLSGSVEITVKYPSSSNDTITACGSYMWHGTTFTSSDATSTWTGQNAVGCDSVVTLKLTILDNSITTPTSISQMLVSDVCGQRIYRYTAATAQNAIGYSWILPTSVGGITGVSIDSGDISTSISIKVKYSSNAAAYNTDSIKVRAYSTCINSFYKSAKLINTASEINTVPASIIQTPVSINNCSAKIYRYAAPALLSDATGWSWSFVGSLSGNGLIDTSVAVLDSGTINSRVIKVRFKTNNAAVTADSVSVAYTSSCGDGPKTTIKLTNVLTSQPAAPASVTITPVTINNCSAKVYRFSASALTSATAATSTTASATGWSWSFTGSLAGNAFTDTTNAVLDSGTVNSQVIKVRFKTNTAATAGDSVRVAFISACGDGARVAAKLTNVATSLTTAPASITITPVTTNNCFAKVYRYTAPALTAATTATSSTASATGWSWSFVGTLSGNGLVDTTIAVIDSGTVNSQVIRIRFKTNTAAATGDSVRVAYRSACGDGARIAAKLTNVATSLTTAPASITITPITINNCSAKVYRYTAPALTAATTATSSTASATGWSWSFVGTLSGNGFSDTTKAVLDSGTINSQVIRVRFKTNTAAATGDSVRVAYRSACGDGARIAAKLTNVATSLTTAPASITITPITINNCSAKVYRYAAPALTTASAATSTIASATGWSWSFTGTLAGNPFVDTTKAVVDSGTINSRVIKVRFKTNTAAAIGDSIRVAYTSSCGDGSKRAAILTNTVILAPVAPTSITISLVSDTCGARRYRYTAPTLPAGTTTSATPTGYLWLMPIGTVGSTGILDSGSLTSRIIRIKYSSNAAAGTGDSIKVAYTSSCGNSINLTTKLTNLVAVILSAPTSLTGTTNICSIVGTPTSTAYTASVVTGAVSYVWTIPSGALIDSGGTGLKIKVRFITAGSNDSIYVQAKGNNQCLSAKKVLKLVTTGCATLKKSIAIIATTKTAINNKILSWEIYPNPSMSNFKILVRDELNNSIGLNQVTAKVFDIQGRFIRNYVFSSNCVFSFGDELKAGIYIIEIRKDSETKKAKVVKY